MTNHATNPASTPTQEELEALSDRELRDIVAAREPDSAGIMRCLPEKLSRYQREWLLVALVAPSKVSLRETTDFILDDEGRGWPTRSWAIENPASGAALAHGATVVFFPGCNQQIICYMGLHVVGSRIGTWVTFNTDKSIAEFTQYGPMSGLINLLFRLHASWARWRASFRRLVKQWQGLWRRAV